MESGTFCRKQVQIVIPGPPNPGIVAAEDRWTRLNNGLDPSWGALTRKTGAALAPGNQATLDALQDPERRPAQPRAPLPEDLAQSTRTCSAATSCHLGGELLVDLRA